MSEHSANNRRMIRWIMLVVLVWGATLALGAFLFGVDPETREVTLAPNPLRGLIVLLCVGAFLGIWAFLLLHSRRTSGDRNTGSIDSQRVAGGDRFRSGDGKNAR